ncbi:MAG TPA: transglycosylase domain-containing protein [Acidimicrobiia bacterium]|nr:transglycosylase domain-containing protein [Acidimicrobiia bacterium]
MASRSPIHELEQRERRGRWFVALATLLSIAIIASTWIGLFSFMGANAAFGTFQELEEKYIPNVDAQLLELPDLSRVSEIYALDGTPLAILHDGRVSEPVPYDDIPEHVVYAVLAAEDADFFLHEGIDVPAIASAFIDNLRYDTTRGGSTITQQVVKKVFVGDEISYERKIIEAVTAVELERRYTKEQILEFYVNFVYFGSSAYGIAAAADEFFGKSVDQLTIAEAATLAVLPRNPTVYDPRRYPEDTEERRNDVIDTMVEHEFISAREGELAKDYPFIIAESSQFAGPADHVVAEVKKQLLNDAEFSFLGNTKEERKKAIFGCPADEADCEGGGGLKVFVTIDLDLQAVANEMLTSWLPQPDTSTMSPGELDACIGRYNATATAVPSVDRLHCAPTGAIAMVDNATGAVQVMASGLPFDQEQFDYAVQGRRNPGSSFKPFALVAALESGIPLGSFWDARSPKEIECPYICSSLGNIWIVSNAGGGGGLMKLFQATHNSVNVVFAQVALAVGPDKIVDVAHRMGIESELAAVPSITLGAGAVSPLEMASAYSNFATNGVWARSYLIERIEAANGDVIYQHQIEHRQTVDPAVIAAARQPLTVVPTASGTARRANIGRPQGGKTGTHQNYMEAWYVGFVPQYSTAVWVGYPDFQYPLRDVVINGEAYSRVFGGSVPGPIWAEFMNVVLADIPAVGFPPDPAGTAQYLTTPSTVVPLVEGMILEDAENGIFEAHLSPEIKEVGSPEPEGTVLTQLPIAGEEVPQGTAVVIEVSTGKPAEAPMIGLAGMTIEQVIEALRLFEETTGVALSFNIQYYVTTDPAQVDTVIFTNPGFGQIVNADTVVTIFVGRLNN